MNADRSSDLNKIQIPLNLEKYLIENHLDRFARNASVTRVWHKLILQQDWIELALDVWHSRSREIPYSTYDIGTSLYIWTRCNRHYARTIGFWILRVQLSVTQNSRNADTHGHKSANVMEFPRIISIPRILVHSRERVTAFNYMYFSSICDWPVF